MNVLGGNQICIVLFCIPLTVVFGHVFIMYYVPYLGAARIPSYWMRSFLPLSKEILEENGC